MGKNTKWIIIGAVVVLVLVIAILLGLRKEKYEFNIDKDNSFIKEAVDLEVYNANRSTKETKVKRTIEVEWSESNNSSNSKVNKEAVVAFVKDSDNHEFYLTEKNRVYVKNKNKYSLLKNNASKLGLYEGKAIVEVSDKVYYIEVKNGKYVIDNELQLEYEETVIENLDLVLPNEAILRKNIKNKLLFDDNKIVLFENGKNLTDSEKNIKALYAIYVASEKEARVYIVADSMKLYVLTDNRTELDSVTKVTSVLVNSKGIEIDTEDGKLVFENK